MISNKMKILAICIAAIVVVAGITVVVLHKDNEKKDTTETRMFVFDNDNSKTYVYDISDGNMTLIESYDLTMNVLPTYSGYFDGPIEATNSDGYVLLFIPNTTSITVLNTGLNGENATDPEIVTTISVGKPVHSCISPDGDYVCFALDNDNAAIVISVDEPTEHETYTFTGATSSSHATVVIDDDNLLYFADMREAQGSNLWIVDIETGEEILSEGDAGTSPHGGFYSSVTDKVYLNCADGISVLDTDGFESLISYTHTDKGRLSRSWLSEDGKTLISYVGSTAQGLAYSQIVAYDLVTGELTADLSVSVASMSDNGWPASILVGDTVYISDPATGKVIMADVDSETVTSLDLDLDDVPQALRVVEDTETGYVWTLCEDGTAICIDPSDGSIIATYDTGSVFGNNLVIAVVTN
jgi:zinc transport system substrate-binding protein